MSDVWFTAGLLLGERTDCDAVVERHNERVEPRDLVWILGNAATSMSAVPQIERFNGRKYLVCGDLDPAFAAHHPPGGKVAEVAKSYMELAPSLLGVVTGKAYPRDRMPIRSHLGLGIGTIDLWHFAWSIGPAFPGDPYAAYRQPPASRERRWQLCGDQPPQVRVIPERRLINVTADAWGRPIHAEEIREIVQKGQS